MHTDAPDEEEIEYDPIYDPFNPELIADPYPFYEQLRDEHPVHYNERMDFYVLSRYDDIFHALRKPQIFSSAQGLTPAKDEISQLGRRNQPTRHSTDFHHDGSAGSHPAPALDHQGFHARYGQGARTDDPAVRRRSRRGDETEVG
jgi:hypothetical protein